MVNTECYKTVSVHDELMNMKRVHLIVDEIQLHEYNLPLV